MNKPATRRNWTSFSAHCRHLGAPLKNPADRWCGISDEKRMAVFTVWADRLKGGRYVYWNDTKSPHDKRIGARELHQVIRTVMANGYDAYGILCEAKDPTAEKRERGFFHEDTLLVLRFVTESPGLVAYVDGEIPASEVIGNSRKRLAPFRGTVDDLDVLPAGCEQPERVSTTGSGYRRDDAVREFVLRRAAGVCEHCGTAGFELPNGTRYLEAHHVIALADEGPDTIDNVIALCPAHHREAHYGRSRVVLERSFIQKLRTLNR